MATSRILQRGHSSNSKARQLRFPREPRGIIRPCCLRLLLAENAGTGKFFARASSMPSRWVFTLLHRSCGMLANTASMFGPVCVNASWWIARLRLPRTTRDLLSVSACGWSKGFQSGCGGKRCCPRGSTIRVGRRPLAPGRRFGSITCRARGGRRVSADVAARPTVRRSGQGIAGRAFTAVCSCIRKSQRNACGTR